jgi:hypothetical protein
MGIMYSIKWEEEKDVIIMGDFMYYVSAVLNEQ